MQIAKNVWFNRFCTWMLPQTQYISLKEDKNVKDIYTVWSMQPSFVNDVEDAVCDGWMVPAPILGDLGLGLQRPEASGGELCSCTCLVHFAEGEASDSEHNRFFV